jgi:hypothetical protein
MAYERAWTNVEYDRVSLSYEENSLSGVVFLVLCQTSQDFPCSLYITITHPTELSWICHIYTHLQTEMKRKAAQIFC